MLVAFVAVAASFRPLRATWKATDGFKDPSFCSFDEARYRGMINDNGRTPVFAQAIRRALQDREGQLVVLDIGTGPEALLALIAARAGAKKVYAIEAQPEVAELARRAVAASDDIPPGVVEVLQGFSTDVTLPEKADLLVAEIVGSVASGEGIYATMLDAQRRLLKAPYSAASYIPLVVETLAAPMSYALHHPALSPRGFDWSAVRTDEPPPRFACSSRAIHALSPPQRLECIRLNEPLPLPGSRLQASLAFELCAERMRVAAEECEAALLPAAPSAAAAAAVAAQVAHSISGVGLWPRLVMDATGTLVVESRGADGSAQPSHWQTVLPLLCTAPLRVDAGDVLRVQATVDLGRAVNAPVEYALEAELIPAEYAQAEYVQAEYAQAEHAQAEHAQAEHAQAEHAQAEHAQAEHAQAEQAGGEHAGGEHAGGEHAEADGVGPHNDVAPLRRRAEASPCDNDFSESHPTQLSTR